jgi:hypothetical protein
MEEKEEEEPPDKSLEAPKKKEVATKAGPAKAELNTGYSRPA